MTRDLRRISIAAIVLLVLVRISIGWQFLYEGLWKIDSQGTANPWTAEGYLNAAQGPFRDHFRNMTGDPDDLTWVDYDTMIRRWDQWHKAFVDHYLLSESEIEGMKQEIDRLEKQGDKLAKDQARRLQDLKTRLQLDARQKDHLHKMINGEKYFAAVLMELPESVRPNVQKDGRFTKSLANVIRYDAQRKLLVVSGQMHLAPHERDALMQMAPLDPEASPEQNAQAKAFQKAVDDVYKRSTRYANHEVTGLAFKERLRGVLRGDPERYGYVVRAAEQARAKRGDDNDQKADTPRPQPVTVIARPGKIELYKQRVREYNEAIGRAETDYQWDHLNFLQRKLQELKAEVVAPIKALDTELKEQAQLLLTDEQLARGPVPLPRTPVQQIDWLTMWSLTVIGLLLIGGLATPLAALAGAGLLTMFYLVIPPWTGVPEAPGPEHSWVVNKNFIEALILLGIVFLPTGRWFGLDAIVNWLWVRLTSRRRTAAPVEEKRVEPLPKAEKPEPAATPAH